MKTFEGLGLKIFTDNVEQKAIDQILELMQIPVFQVLATFICGDDNESPYV